MGGQHNNRLRELRKQTGKTQAQIAAELGVNKATYSTWELGRTELKADNIVKLAKYFGCSPNEILGFDGRSSLRTMDIFEEHYVTLFQKLAPNYRDAIIEIMSGCAKPRPPRRPKA
ncbi:MAG: helix-turn-helix transcriptional regulator [Atopobiaceae bacterium]|nr:helix-turn-helix transcriptional regulator [Atopobiaceae bacterium]